MLSEYIFVYGTLRKAGGADMHRVLARHGVFCSEAMMQGRLYEIEGYPGAVMSGNSNDRVHGELYRLLDSEAVWRQLDEYEGSADHFPEPREYLRKKVSVRLPGGEHVSAWVYLYNHDISCRVRIGSGDYLRFLHGEE